MIIFGLISLALVIANFGFYLPDYVMRASVDILYAIAIGYCLLEVYRSGWGFHSWRGYFVNRWFEASIGLYLFTYMIFSGIYISFWQTVRPTADAQEVTIASLGIPLGALFVVQFVGYLRLFIKRTKIALRPAQIFVLSFLFPIFIGTLLLKMPRSTVESISWIDALFTATSAICVSGLTVLDISKVFTPLGQGFIATFIQIGGLGIMTLTITFATFFSGGIGIRERILMSDLLSEDRVGEVKGLLLRICAFTFVIELVGAVLLYLTVGGSFLNFDRVRFYTALFHSISAFCNAGFTLFSQGLYDPALRDNYAFASVIMVLIILGGLGFPVLANLFDIAISYRSRARQRLMTTTSKMILAMTAILLPCGAALVFFTERTHSFAEFSLFDQIFHSLFLSVTTRTAGFNIWPTEMLSLQTTLVMMVLMWIGGSPMSTAGGVKSITVLVAALNIRSQVLGLNRVEIFGRQIKQVSVNRAFAAIFISVVLVIFGSICMFIIEPQLNVIDGVFEVVSAVGTAGLSRGLTGELDNGGRLLITFLMFVGRIGAITIVSALFAPPKSEKYKLLEDGVIIY